MKKLLIASILLPVLLLAGCGNEVREEIAEDIEQTEGTEHTEATPKDVIKKEVTALTPDSVEALVESNREDVDIYFDVWKKSMIVARYYRLSEEHYKLELQSDETTSKDENSPTIEEDENIRLDYQVAKVNMEKLKTADQNIIVKIQRNIQHLKTNKELLSFLYSLEQLEKLNEALDVYVEVNLKFETEDKEKVFALANNGSGIMDITHSMVKEKIVSFIINGVYTEEELETVRVQKAESGNGKGNPETTEVKNK